MSAISAALKKAHQVFWIVRATLGGRIYWWSTKTLIIPYSGGDDIHVDGLMLTAPSFSQSLDLKTLRASVPSVNIELANSARLQDIEDIIEVDNSYVDLFIWADGLDWADIETNGLLLRGLFQKDYHTRSKYAFSVVDLSKWVDKTIPPFLISPDTWPSLRLTDGAGSVANKTQPILFGEFNKGVPLLCVDTTAFKYLVCNNLVLSAASDYTAGTEAVWIKAGTTVNTTSYALTNGYDSQGNIAIYHDFTAAQTSNEPLTCSIQGITDDGVGTYTGTALALIELPGSIIHYLFSNFTSLPAENIDITSIKAVNQLLPNIRLAVYINDQSPCADIIDRICNQIVAFRASLVGGKIGVIVPDLNGATVGYIDFDKDGLPESLKFSRTPLDSVANNLSVQYAYNPDTRAFEKLLLRDRTNNLLCEASYYDYGEMPRKTIKLYDAHVQATAESLAVRHISMYSQRRTILEVTSAPWVVWDYKLGDIVGITVADAPATDGGGWVSRRCLLIEKNYQSSTIATKWLDIE